MLAGLIALLFLPWLLLILGERQGALGSLRPLAQGGELNVIKPLTDLAFLAFGMGSQPLYVGVALFFTLALLLLLLVAARRAPAADRPALALLWLLLAAALSPLAVYFVRPFFLPARTLAAASPFWLLLWAWGATQRRTPLPYLVALAAVTMAAGSLLYLAGEPVKPPYREAMALVARALEPGDAVLHTSDGSYLPALRYVSARAAWPAAGRSRSAQAALGLRGLRRHALEPGRSSRRRRAAVAGGCAGAQPGLAAGAGWLV
jgi:hypothetical protein